MADEVTVLLGGSIEYLVDGNDIPSYIDVTHLKGMAIEFALNDAEMIVNEVTKIQGSALELIDYPFEITETRL